MVQEKARPEWALRCLESPVCVAVTSASCHHTGKQTETRGAALRDSVCPPCALPAAGARHRVQHVLRAGHSPQLQTPGQRHLFQHSVYRFKNSLSLNSKKTYLHNHYKQKKTDGLSWPNSQIANYKEASGHNFHGSHCNTHFPIFSNKKLLKKIRNENCSIRVDEPFSTRLLSKCHGPVVPPVATPRNLVHLFESVLNRTI